MLDYEHGELRNVYIKELTLKLWPYKKLFSIYLPTDLSLLEHMSRFSQTVSGPKNLAIPPLGDEEEFNFPA